MIWFWSLASLLGFGGYYLLDKSKKSSTPFGSPEVATREGSAPLGARQSLVDEASKVPTSKGPWYAMASGLRSALVPQKGKRYLAKVTAMGYSPVYWITEAVVEGTWTGLEDNTKPGALRVGKVLSAKGGPNGKFFAPEVPFTLEIPPTFESSTGNTTNLYLVEDKWDVLHPTSVGESAYSDIKPPVGTFVLYAMKQREPGDGVVVFSGRVVPDSSSYWPKDAGAPGKDRVLVSVDGIDRVVRGTKDVSMPSAFVIPVDHIIVKQFEV